ncbi:MAG TPA: NADP oxidoreductase [Armatimonadota bacterium]|jgi:NAD-reducing hydrogenase small subunit|nr:NADP oxidoreductase [Armatimonadota bacterium]HOJ22874.1 NADP oxidoreductase [Armatimonadota bacterium]HOM82394.1 NADP oxidoreductase [Armatimonadota bacterium]HPO73108.1 NADP oxidoreductase [Armatimonadota bacterium]HPT98877.1 NADP oxidoreductase [Armatimonadota bacterium]
MAKVKIATDWLAGCAGCHMSLLDLDEELVTILGEVELTSSPITDLKHPPEVTVGIVEGAVANTANINTLKEMREKCQILLALGDCACFGGIPTMRNLVGTEEALKRAYIETPSTVDGEVPSDPELCQLLDRTRACNEVVKVDAYLPGCPPSAQAIGWAIKELLEGRLPEPVGENLRYD